MSSSAPAAPGPLFTVIVPTHGRPRLLTEAVASVLRQSVNDLECIVVDDASPRPVEVPEDPRVRVVRHDVNRGEPAARNTGLAAARGRFVTWLDDDDVYTPGRLAIACEGLARADVAVCWRREVDGPARGNRALEGDVRDEILDHMTPQMGQVALRKEVAMTFDERFQALPDVEWWLRVAHRARVATVPRVGLHYRLHAGARNRNGLDARVRCSLLLLETHAGYFTSHPAAAAFRWRRIGIMATQLGDYRVARAALRRSLRLRADAATAWHLARSLRPTRSGARPLAADDAPA
jgi:glycosyltransferase involved in cell wall biosynthesis